jgi:hypothetical protein
MTRDEGLEYIRRVFQDPEDAPEDGWWHPRNGETFESLYKQLLDDHGLSPTRALGILESAYEAAADEFGA